MSTLDDLQRITRGELTGDQAADVLRQAIHLRRVVEDHARDLAAKIKDAEDYLVYGPLRRPGHDTYR